MGGWRSFITSPVIFLGNENNYSLMCSIQSYIHLFMLDYIFFITLCIFRDSWHVLGAFSVTIFFSIPSNLLSSAIFSSSIFPIARFAPIKTPYSQTYQKKWIADAPSFQIPILIIAFDDIITYIRHQLSFVRNCTIFDNHICFFQCR